MSIISTTDFILNEDLPTDELGSILTQYITEYETEILEKCLGYELAKDFQAALAGTPDQKWIDLRDGEEYEYNTYLEKYKGIKDIIVDYVYWNFSVQNQKYASSVGIKVVNTENSEIASPREKQVIAYNDMIDRKLTLDRFIDYQNEQTEDTYPNYNPETIEKGNVFNI